SARKQAAQQQAQSDQQLGIANQQAAIQTQTNAQAAADAASARQQNRIQLAQQQQNADAADATTAQTMASVIKTPRGRRLLMGDQSGLGGGISRVGGGA